MRAIRDAIPHRPPMLLVDEVVQRDQESIVCRKTFCPDEFFFHGHYPGSPVVPGVILCECGAQAGALLLSPLVPKDAGLPVLTRLSDAKFKGIVRPGDTIEMHVRLDDTISNAYFLTARIIGNGKTVARFSFACTMAGADLLPPNSDESTAATGGSTVPSTNNDRET